jgi:hypothetical protein
MEDFDECVEDEAEVRLDLVMPADAFVPRLELLAFLIVCAVEAFQLPVCFP